MIREDISSVGMIVDVHTHIGGDLDGAMQSKEELLLSMKANKIDKAVVFPFNEKGNVLEKSIELLGKCGKDRRFINFLRFDPKRITKDTLEEHLPLFRGVKLHPRSQNFDPLDKKYFWIYKMIEGARKPVIFHTRKENNPNSDPDRIVKLAALFPRMNIIIGHFAGASNVAFGEIAARRNLYVETSVLSSNYLIGYVTKKVVGADKVIFGSDAPYSDQEIELLKIKKAGLSRSDERKVLGGNISKLLKLDG